MGILGLTYLGDNICQDKQCAYKSKDTKQSVEKNAFVKASEYLSSLLTKLQ